MNTLNIALRGPTRTARISDDPRPEEVQAPRVVRAPRRSAHRADIGGTSAASDMLTRLAVILLSSINAVMWEVYTEARVMGAVWAVIAIGFAIWIKRDAGR